MSLDENNIITDIPFRNKKILSIIKASNVTEMERGGYDETQ